MCLFYFLGAKKEDLSIHGITKNSDFGKDGLKMQP